MTATDLGLDRLDLMLSTRLARHAESGTGRLPTPKPTPARSDLLAAADAHISRCTCGAWIWRHTPCGACGWLHKEGVAA